MSLKLPVYLDYQATTPVDKRVLDVMLPYFTEHFGNPASKTHSFGNAAHVAVEASREILAASIQGKPQEIIFTSGATEAINLAIKGTAVANRERGKHFITLETEHKAVLDCFEWLGSNGYETTILPVKTDGLIDIEALRKAIRPETVLVAVMAVNNEIGVIQPIDSIGALCREYGVYFFCDGTQALGKIAIDVNRSKIDLLAASAHKVYGPKGIGFCFVRRSNPRVELEAIVHGGGHEKGLRSGTLATPQIVGFAEAVRVSVREMKSEQSHLLNLRTLFLERLQAALPDVRVNGNLEKRIAGNLNIQIPGIDSEALIVALQQDIAISSGSACTSAAVLPSHVLVALGLDEDSVRSSIRVGFGRSTSVDEALHAASRVVEQAKRIRSLRAGL